MLCIEVPSLFPTARSTASEGLSFRGKLPEVFTATLGGYRSSTLPQFGGYGGEFGLVNEVFHNTLRGIYKFPAARKGAFRHRLASHRQFHLRQQPAQGV